MPEPSNHNGNIPPNKKSSKGGWLTALFIGVCAVGAFTYFKDAQENSKSARKPMEFSYADLKDRVKKDPAKLTGVTIVNNSAGRAVGIKGSFDDYPFFVSKLAEDDKKPFTLLYDAGIKPRIETESDNSWIWHMIPIAISVAILLVLWKALSASRNGGGATAFGQSKARLAGAGEKKVTLADVAGVDEAKESVGEMVEYLRDPKKFTRLGARLPKGILMVGPPGTGKTLLAKAVAGEADVPFFSMAGSDFVEMFVGVGASRVRDTFAKARKNAPCVIFIDEIDAVGKKRGGFAGGGNDEREQTLNALLVEMDGMSGSEGIIIIAATNRVDVLDDALVRPGRFDRQVHVDLPDIKGREQILKVHARKMIINADVSFLKVAESTPGLSGAELANVMNEAALLAAKRGKKAIDQSDIMDARSTELFGKAKKSRVRHDEELDILANHEGAHALVQYFMGGPESIVGTTIIGRAGSEGHMERVLKEGLRGRARKEMITLATVAVAGRIGEEILSGGDTGKITDGAIGDIQQATRIAEHMVLRGGLSEAAGMVNYEPTDTEKMMGKTSKDLPEAVKTMLHNEIKNIIDDAYRNAKQILTDNRPAFERLVSELRRKETLDREEIRALIEGKVFASAPQPPANDNKDAAPSAPAAPAIS